MKLKTLLFFIPFISLTLLLFTGISVKAQTNIEDINEYTKKCNYYWRVNLDSAIYFGKQAVHIANENNMQNDEASKANMFLGVSFFYQGNYDSAINYITKGLKISESIESIWGQGFGNNMLTILMRKKGDFEKSIEYGNSTIEFRKKTKDTFNLAGAYNNIATSYNAMGDYKSAIEYQSIALNLRIKTNDTIGTIMGHGNIANLYLNMGNVDLAKEHIDKAIELTKDGTLECADNYIILGDIFHTNYNQPDTALALYKIALSIYTEIGIDDGIAVANENIGSTLLDLHNYSNALEHLRLAKDIFIDINDLSQVAHVDMSIGNYYKQTNNYDSATYYLEKALLLSREVNQPKVIRESLGLLYLLNKEQNNLIVSLNFLEQYKNYSDSLSTSEAYEKMALLEAKYKTAEKENTIIQFKYKEAQHEWQQKLLTIIIISIILLVIIIGIAIYVKRKKEIEIAKQKQQLLISQKKLAETEIEKQKIKQVEMANDIEHKARQLSSHALHMMQKSNMLQEVKQNLIESIKNAKPENKPELRNISRLIEQNMKTEKEWELFKMYFEQVNNDFYSKLKNYNSELSQTDIRMCSLTKLGLNLKETASVLNVAPNTVKNARYRVKQKLGLGANDSLSDFIDGL